MNDDPILAALARLEAGQTALEAGQTALKAGQTALEAGQTALKAGQTALEAGQTALRVDLMARMDRLQHRMDSLDEHLTLGFGHSDRVERRAQAVSEDNRLLGEQMVILTKLLRQLEGRINGLEERK
jgi:hypothetical protein